MIPADVPQVDLGGIVFNTGTPGPYGLRWYCTTPLDGWLVAPPRLTLLDRTADDGQAQASYRYGPRTMTLSGLVEFTSTLDVVHAQIEALGRSSSGGVALTVYESPAKTLTVIRNGPIVLGGGGREGSRRALTFSVPLLALRPLKLSATVNHQDLFPGPNTVVNAGNYPTMYALRRLGAGSRFTLTNSTDSSLVVAYTASTSGGDTLDIDAWVRSVTVNGLNRYGFSTGTTWFRLLPGSNSLTLAGTDPEIVKISWQDGWM